jgi:hypothetical protein
MTGGEANMGIEREMWELLVDDVFDNIKAASQCSKLSLEYCVASAHQSLWIPTAAVDIYRDLSSVTNGSIPPGVTSNSDVQLQQYATHNRCELFVAPYQDTEGAIYWEM